MGISNGSVMRTAVDQYWIQQPVIIFDIGFYKVVLHVIEVDNEIIIKNVAMQ